MCERIIIPHVLVPVLYDMFSAIVNKSLCVLREKKNCFIFLHR